MRIKVCLDITTPASQENGKEFQHRLSKFKVFELFSHFEIAVTLICKIYLWCIVNNRPISRTVCSYALQCGDVASGVT